MNEWENGRESQKYQCKIRPTESMPGKPWLPCSHPLFLVTL